MNKTIKILIVLLILTGCYKTEKSLLDDVTNSEYSYTICKSSCDNESNNLNDATNQAKIAGISEDRIEAAKALGRDKGARELDALRIKLENKCRSEKKVVCSSGNGCCKEVVRPSFAEALRSMRLNSTPDADSTALSALEEQRSAENDLKIKSIESDIKYAMDSYRYFYKISASDEYPKDVYPPQVRMKFSGVELISCYSLSEVDCKNKILKEYNKKSVELIYKWVGSVDFDTNAWKVIDNKVREKARIDYDILVQRGADLTTKQAVDEASDYAKNAAKDYYPQIALDVLENEDNPSGL